MVKIDFHNKQIKKNINNNYDKQVKKMWIVVMESLTVMIT